MALRELSLLEGVDKVLRLIVDMHAEGPRDHDVPVGVGGWARLKPAGLSSPTRRRTVLVLVCLGLAELGAKHSDLVDELSDHLCSHRRSPAEPLAVVEQSEPLLG